MLKQIVAAALKKGHRFQTSEELASQAASSVQYAGGYLYSGATWTLNHQELKSLRHSVKDYDHGGHEEADTATNLEMLGSAHLNAQLYYESHLTSGVERMAYLKTWDGWICINTTWTPDNAMEPDEFWDAALEVEKEVERHAKALAKAKARANAEAEHHAMYSLEARAHLRMA